MHHACHGRPAEEDQARDPARAIQEINLDEQSVHVGLTTDEVSASPEYDEQLGVDENCEAKVEEYYGGILSR